MLKGKTAVVTGSTSGIGLGIARALAEVGCTVILNSHEDPIQIEPLRMRLAQETGAQVFFFRADLTRPEEIYGLMDFAAGRFGGVDILVNNAGIQHVAPIAEFPAPLWDKVLAINLSAAFHTTKAALPAMRQKKWGRIINIASAHGLVASPFKAAYIAAKHGLVGLTKVTALEAAEDGITCNALCPGYVRTPLVENQIEDQMKVHHLSREAVIRDVLLAPQPTKRFVAIEEVAAFAVFLCSDTAASITGAALPIDGGWVAK